MKTWRWMLTLTASAGFLLAVVGCSGASASELAAVGVGDALGTSSASTNAAEIAGMLAGEAARPHPGGFEGFACDRNPDITYVTVCGKQFPASVHLEWADCSAPPPPPPGDRGPGGASSGTVDLTTTVTAQGDCASNPALKFDQT